MFALTVLLILVAYLLISLGVILAARATARRKGRRPWLWGWVAAIAMYHLVFWDLIPTAILYPWYQAKEAGLWVYKSKEQWLVNNPGVEPDVGLKVAPDVTFSESPYVLTISLNARFDVVEKRTDRWPRITHIDQTIVDKEGDDVLVRRVYFQSGNCGEPQHYRFWVKRCDIDTLLYAAEFSHLKNSFSAIGVTK